MWRSLVIALGIMAIIVGLECLAIDSATFYSGETRTFSFLNPASTPSFSTREWRPKDWLPWTLIAGGVITILYSFTLPRRFRTAAA